jgi:site-specific DNA-methyltransferase (cytosine-N4-specific)
MKRLIKTGKYNPGVRPSEHVIGEDTFTKDNSGAISGSTLIMGNTATDPNYRRWCQEQGLGLHPARMPIRLAEFFIRFLTEPGDQVLDPFGGSNTTGRAAENLSRKWVSCEMNLDYARGSHGRFIQP